MNAELDDQSQGKAFRRRLFGLSVDRDNQLRKARQDYRLLFSPKKQKTEENKDKDKPSVAVASVSSSRQDEEVDAFGSSLNPLQNEYILEMVANYLPGQDLKNCRLVCRLWGREMARCLGARKSLIISDEQCPNALSAAASVLRKELVSVSDLCFFDINSQSDLFKKLVAVFGWTLSGLQFEECQTTPKDIAELLKFQTPNLESFSYEAKASKESQIVSTFVQIQTHLKEQLRLPELKKLYWNEEFGRVRLEEIVSICPNLIELIYKNTPLPCPQVLKNKKARWDSLRILKFSPRDELREDHYLSLIALKLKLKSLTLFGVNPTGKSRMESLTKLLKSLAPTLTELELFQHFMISDLYPISKNYNYVSPFPVKLPKLQMLNVDFCILNSLTAIDSMESLHTLECRSKDHKDWKDKGLPRKGSTVRSLRIGAIDSKFLLKFSNSFKKCVNLEVDGENIDDEALRIIIKGFPQLEQFTISKLPTCSTIKLTDSGITGLPSRICRKWRTQTQPFELGNYLENKKHPAIYDLKKLCRLELCGLNSSLSDISVLYGIANCPELIILGLPSCQITDASLTAIVGGLPDLGVFELQYCPKVSNDGISRLKSSAKFLFQYDILKLGDRDMIEPEPDF